jgi:hypothetical protein
LKVHPTTSELEAGLASAGASPDDNGVLEMIVRRPHVGKREVLTDGELDPAEGLVGDNWRMRGGWDTADGSADPDVQLTLMSSRVIAAIAGDRSRWADAGDQLYVDLDLSEANLPAGTRLAIGTAIVEISAKPHTGCRKFIGRFGVDAQKFVNSPSGRRLRLRGVNARVIRDGVIKVGDVVRKVR